MIPLFFLKIDLIQFFNALFLLTSAGVCFLIFENKRKDLFWQDFRWFFIIQGANQLLAALPFYAFNHNNTWPTFLRYFLLLLSFLPLSEIIRKSNLKFFPRLKISSIWGIYYFFILAAFFIFKQKDLFNNLFLDYVVFICLNLGIVVSLLNFLKELKSRNIQLFLFTFVSCLVLESCFFYYNLNQIVFIKQSLFVAHSLKDYVFEFIRLVLSAALCFSLYFFYQFNNIEKNSKKIKNLVFFIFQGCIFVLASLVIVNFLGIFSSVNSKNETLKRVESAASLIDRSRVKKLTGSINDSVTTNFEEVRYKLVVLHEANPDYRFVYLVGFKDGKIVFLADSENSNSPDYSKPGDVWEDAPQILNKFKNINQAGFTYGPYIDKWGRWFTSFAPIRDLETKELLAVLAFDIDEKKSLERTTIVRFYGMVFSFIYFFMLLMMFITNELSRLNLLKLQDSERNFRAVFDFAPGGIVILDILTNKIVMANKEFLKMLGFKLEEIIGVNFDDFHNSNCTCHNKVKSFENLDVSFAEHIYLKKDKSLFFAEVLSANMKFEDKECILVFVTDVTERRFVQNALKASEGKFRNIFENAVEGIFQTTQQGKYLSINPAFVKMFGFDSEQELKEHVSNIGSQMYVNSSERDLLISKLEKEGVVRDFEAQLIKKDSRKIWVSINAQTIRDPNNGRTLYYEGTIVDITAHKEYEKSLQEKEKMYRALAENLPDIVYRVFVKENARMEFFNNMLQKITGYSKEELVKGEFSLLDSIIYPDDRPHFLNIVRKALEHNVPFTAKYRIIKKDGSLCYCMERARLIMDNDGSLLFVEGVIYDITDLIETENKLKLTLLDLQKVHLELKGAKNQLIESEKMALLGRLSAGIAHEIRNPLGIIQGGVEFLESETVDEDEDTKIIYGKIIDSIVRIDKIINSMLSFAKVPKIKFEKIQPIKLVNTVLSLLEYRFRLTNVGIVFNFKGEIPDIEVDKVQIEQVVSNIVVNAIDAMPEGGTININLGTEERKSNLGIVKKYCMIKLIDSGLGMTTEDLHKIFHPFFTSKDVKKGTGLGLYISKMIIENHQGFLEIESELGKGTVVKVLLPYTH